MNNDYIDEDDVTLVLDKKEIIIDNNLKKDLDNKLAYVTNTKNYDTMKFDIISPEELENESERRETNNPNPEFYDSIKYLEDMYQRQLTKEEYLKACDTYATILVERDEEKRKNYEGHYQINPIKKERYFKLLLQNKPVDTAFQESMKEYEGVMVDSVLSAYNEAKEKEMKVLNMKDNNRVNVRYKGKCRIAVDEGGKVVVIDNKNDVNLLRMKYRKEWIDKHYPDIDKPIAIRPDEDDEFK
jgi:hypothetical protein